MQYSLNFHKKKIKHIRFPSYSPLQTKSHCSIVIQTNPTYIIFDFKTSETMKNSLRLIEKW